MPSINLFKGLHLYILFFFQRNHLLASSDKPQGTGIAMQELMRKKLIQLKQIRRANEICVLATL